MAASDTLSGGRAGNGSKWLKRASIALVAGVAVGYCIIAGFVYFKQEGLIFRPSPLPADHQFNIVGVEEVSIAVNGATLSALHLKLPNPQGVVFFLHGNAGNLQSWMTNTDFYRRVNYDLFMIDYRGYGKSSGRIESEAQLHEDVRTAWNSVAPQYAGRKIVVYGRSLGTGLATRLASEIQPTLTVLVSPYFSLEAMANEIYPWLPGFINRYPMTTDQWIGHIKRKVVIAHGDHDTLIPLSHGERLKKLREATELMVITGAGHNDIQKFPAYLDGLAEHLQKL